MESATNTAPTVQPTVSSLELRCILHIERNTAKKARRDVLPFEDTQWGAVERAAANRRQKRNFQHSVYCGVIQRLPTSPAQTDGYRVSCYKNFTAVSSQTPPAEAASDVQRSNDPHLRSSQESVPSTSSAGILTPVCLFCEKKTKRVKGGSVELLGRCETIQAGLSIQNAAKTLHDSKVMPKVVDTDLIAKEAHYHHSCRSAYLLSANRVSQKDTRETKTPSETGLLDIFAYIEQSIIIDNRPELLNSVYERYLDICSASGETPMGSAFSLSRTLMSHFKGRVKIQSPLGKKLGNIIHNAETTDEAIRVVYDYTSTDERTIAKAALLLRNQLLQVEKVDLPECPTLDDLRNGDSSPPKLVVYFFNILYGGLKSEPYTESVKRRANSSSQDALFIVQQGRAKPAKHVALGMSVKSVTGSKKMVQVLNRFGHCLSYNTLEEVETATAESIHEQKLACPPGTVVGEPVGLAFDNFDEMTQTLSGANSLHDTMGILYQNVPATDEERNASAVVAVATSSSRRQVKTGKRRRTLQSTDTELQPYRNTPKMTNFSYQNTAVYSLPDVSNKAHNCDLVWMMSHAIGNDVLPMWVGFNASIYSDHLPKQDVRYMPNLRQPITNLEVVRETLLITQKCANETGQKYGIVSYDLGAAKPALQIQVTEKPEFDNIFIMLGPFHIEMAFFKAIGKLLSNSGGPEMLTESEVLATGSLNGFLTGKHFNRCKRLHPILALALEMLHFSSFLNSYPHREETEALISNIQLTMGEELQSALDSDVFKACTAAYEVFTQVTRTGGHGATAQFWRMYIDYIHEYHVLERAIRTNDIDLYTYSLTGLIGLFFATNHVNYSRWLTKFQLDLMNMDDSHPGLRQILEAGVFTVRRTEHPFSRCPVDLTVEQTINADAASRLTGITSSTNNYAARLRWMLTKSTRASFVSLLHEMAGLIVKENTTALLRPARIKRDDRDVKTVVKQIQDSCNPFGNEIDADTMLYNIHTGKATSETVRESLLNVPASGRTLHQAFITACEADDSRFEQPIKKAPLKTFVDDCARNRRTPDKKVAVLKCTRDLMGRLLILASKRDVDLQLPISPYTSTTHDVQS